MDTFLVRSDLTLVQAHGRRGNYASDGGAGREKGAEGDHFDC